MSGGKKTTLRGMQQKKKQLRKPKSLSASGLDESTGIRKQKSSESQEKVGQKRKRQDSDAQEDDESDSEEESGDDLLLSNQANEEKGEFSFEFSDMKEEFYGGIQLMLSKQLYSTGAAHDIAEVIIKQDELGTVVHCEGETDVFAYATIIPATQLTGIEFVRQVANYVDHHSQSTANQECKRILNAIAQQDATVTKYGMLFHDRYINFPLELIHQLHHNLSEDLTWILDPAQRSSEIPAAILQRFESMEQIVIFRPCAPEGDSNTSSGSDLKIQNVTGSSSIMFDYFEDDIYFEHAEHAWKLKLDPKLFKVSNYIMMVVAKNNISRIANSLQALVNG